MSKWNCPAGRGLSLNYESGSPPAGDLNWGVYCYDSGIVTSPTPSPLNNIARFETLSGKTMPIKPYHTWWYPYSWWVPGLISTITPWANSGAIPLIHVNFWDPFVAALEDATEEQFMAYIPPSITDGDHDTYLNELADELADFDEPVWFRIFHESNHDHRQIGRYLPWDAIITDQYGSVVSGYSDHIAAWRYIVNKFRDRGATKVDFLWSVVGWPSASYGSTNDVVLSGYYPGDDYVDAVGGSMYLVDWYPPSSDYSPADSSLISGIYDELAACTATRPVWFAESGAEPNPSQATYKPQYISNLFNPTVIASDFPRVDTVMYWDSGDMRIEESTSSRDAFVTEINKSTWKSGY